MRLNLRFKLIVYSIALTWLVLITLFAGIFQLDRHYLIDEIGTNLEKIAATTALQLDGDLHDQVSTAASEPSGEAFTSLRAQLLRVRAAAKLDQEPYTFRPKGNEMEFVVMTHQKPFAGATYDYRKYGLQAAVDSVFARGMPTHTQLYQSKSADFISGYAPIKNSADKVVGILCLDFQSESFNNILIERMHKLFWLGLFVLLVTVPIAYMAVRTLSSRIQNTVAHAQTAIATKDLRARLPEKGRDEMATLAASFNRLTGEMHTLIVQLAGNAAQLSASSSGLTQRGATLSESSAAMQHNCQDVAKSVDHVNRQVAQIADEARASATSMEDLTRANRNIGQNLGAMNSASRAMNGDMNSLATAVNHVSETLVQVARNIEETSRITQQATEITTTTNGQVKLLDEAAREIGKVVSVITHIAEKTNLLALNASIEAARAGEAGRGFAVVAIEVKELAFQTAQSTEDIQSRIVEIQNRTTEATESISQITTVMATINQRTFSVNEALERQTETVHAMEERMALASDRSTEVTQKAAAAAALSEEVTTRAAETQKRANEIAAKAEAAAEATQSAHRDTSAVNQRATQTAEAATSLQSQARDLAKMAAALQAMVSEFKL